MAHMTHNILGLKEVVCQGSYFACGESAGGGSIGIEV